MKSAKEEKGKKISILYILRILKEFSDEKHPLSQKQIIELLDSKYGQAINRKSVKRETEGCRISYYLQRSFTGGKGTQ